MDYYVGINNRKAVFKLYDNNRLFYLMKITGLQRGRHPLELKNPPAGFPKHYPSYEVITVDGITEIIEHRKMEPIFYVTDDPAIWKELEVRQQ